MRPATDHGPGGGQTPGHITPISSPLPGPILLMLLTWPPPPRPAPAQHISDADISEILDTVSLLLILDDPPAAGGQISIDQEISPSFDFLFHPMNYVLAVSVKRPSRIIECSRF